MKKYQNIKISNILLIFKIINNRPRLIFVDHNNPECKSFAEFIQKVINTSRRPGGKQYMKLKVNDIAWKDFCEKIIFVESVMPIQKELRCFLEGLNVRDIFFGNEFPLYNVKKLYVVVNNTPTEPATSFEETGMSVANIVSVVGNGIWSPCVTPVNALKDLETNFPLYISDYYDQLSGWSRENLFEHSCDRIGSNISELKSSSHSYPAIGSNGPESALSEKYGKEFKNLQLRN